MLQCRDNSDQSSKKCIWAFTRGERLLEYTPALTISALEKAMKLLQNGRLFELHSMLQCRDNSDRSGKKYMQSASTEVPKFDRLLPVFLLV